MSCVGEGGVSLRRMDQLGSLPKVGVWVGLPLCQSV